MLKAVSGANRGLSSKSRWELSSSRREGSVFLGLFIAGGLVFGAMLLTGAVQNFFNFGSLLLVIGGTLGATIVHCSSADVHQAIRSVRQMRHHVAPSIIEKMQLLVRLSHSVKREGLLALDREAARTTDPFLKLALELAADATPSEEIRRILLLEAQTEEELATRGIHALETMGSYAPAVGLIGTLIGLIQMLGSLHDGAALGSAMALALVTTFYGAVLANLVCLPLAGRLRRLHQGQSSAKAMITEGIASLALQEDPVMLEQRLRSFHAAVAQ